jgi:predicted phage terminase large subunit-like protein
VHEDDLAARLAATGEWEILSLPALDVNNNALDPRLHTTEMLLKIKELTPYVFAAQYQQDPLPPGGAVFKEEWFVLTDDNPEIIATFITCDTAETDKSYNDATVFSFWGVYKIKHGNMDSGVLGLHWLDCVEIRVEPYQLESEFMSFYSACMRFSVKPKLVGIERKSTGTTLVSVLKQYQGLRIVPIERNSASGSKAQRFMEIQQYIASRQVSLTRGAKHTKHCVDHMTKITQNNAHRFDDIADTCADACRMVFIDKVVQGNIIGETEQNALVDKLMQKHRGLSQAYTKRWG